MLVYIILLKSLLLALYSRVALGVVPGGQMSIRYAYKSVDFSIASFGGEFESIGYSSFSRLVNPSSDAKGCDKISTPYVPSTTSYVLLLERGDCSFYDKAKNAQDAGASAVIIYNSLEGIYAGKSYASSRDYECSDGEASVSASSVKKMTSENVYSSTYTDAIPSTCASSRHCKSKICVYTNATASSGDRQACCAWDLYLSMGAESSKSKLHIPVGFITMADYNTLASYKSFSLNIMEVALY